MITLTDQLLDTWRIHQRINHYLLAAIADEHLMAVSASKGRTVGEQFGHIHNVRLMWLQQAAPDLMNNLSKLERGTPLTVADLQSHLAQSGEAVVQLLERGLTEGRIKGFKPHPVGFLGYLIAHESHHRGQIALTLKQAGHPLDKKTAFGLWEWGVR
jgi:uncharacterized damage-inducible protein DinB